MLINGHNITIRPWREDDYVSLLHMVFDCLDTNHQAGADMLPTFKNADALVRLGMLAAAKGEPCLVADLNSELVGNGAIGYTEWLELPNPLGLDFDGRVLHGLGTYVMKPYRNSGLSHHLRTVAEGQAGRLGFTKVVGVAYHDAGLQSVLARGYRVAGQHVEKGL